MLTAAIRQRLVQGAAAVGVPLSAAVVAQLERYLELLLHWNRRINLTRIVDPVAVVDRHFVDCLALAPLLRAEATVLDVGSGAGFPGAVLAVARPDLRVTLCESVGKKAAFLRALVQTLALRCHVEDARSETLARAGRTFEVVVSRAVLPPPAWVAHAAPLVAPGGLLVAMVAEAAPEVPRPTGFAPPSRHPYALPDGSPRALLCWRRST